MAILKSSKQIFEFSLDEMTKLVASDLSVDPTRVHVEYVIGDTGPGDPMDRYPAPRGVVGIRVTVDNPNVDPVRWAAVRSSLASQIEAVESQTSQWGDR